MELEPITREEMFLSAIAGDTSTDDLPTPETRIEFFLQEIIDNGSGGGGGGTSNYNSLTNKPQINGHTLSGNKTSADIGVLDGSTKYAASIALSIDSSTFVVTAQLKDQDGNNLGSAQTIDLPLETMVVSGSYDAETEKIVLTLKNGQTVEFSVAALVSGLQSEITAQNKLDADLVDDSESTNKFVTASDKTAWAGKQDALTFDGTYDASTNPAATVSTVTNAIAGLDVANAGGAGKYIAAISETDGKISATAETMDTVPTANSTKAVTSGGVYTPLTEDRSALVELVDRGAKNLIDCSLYTIKSDPNNNGGANNFSWNNNVCSTTRNVSFTINSDNSISILANNVTYDVWFRIARGFIYAQNITYIMSGCPSDGSTSKYYMESDNLNERDTGAGISITNAADYSDDIYIVIKAGVTAEVTFFPMICTKAAWDISHEYVQYCPSLYELYQMILNAQ